MSERKQSPRKEKPKNGVSHAKNATNQPDPFEASHYTGLSIERKEYAKSEQRRLEQLQARKKSTQKVNISGGIPATTQNIIPRKNRHFK